MIIRGGYNDKSLALKEDDDVKHKIEKHNKQNVSFFQLKIFLKTKM